MSVDSCMSEDSVGSVAVAAAAVSLLSEHPRPDISGIMASPGFQLPTVRGSSTTAPHSDTPNTDVEPIKCTHVNANNASAVRNRAFLETETWPTKQPMQAQLTIFYAGAVSVYEDVPREKAQAIMLLAGDGKSWPNNPLTHSIVPSQGKPAAAPAFTPSEPPVFIPYLSEPDQQLVKRTHAELPFARKVSLARFLEKRKDRIHAKLLAAEEQTKGWVKFGEDEARYKKQALSQCSTAPRALKRLCS